MSCFFLLILLCFSCQSVPWRAPESWQPRGSAQDRDRLGSTQFPPSVVAGDQDKGAEDESTRDPTKRKEVAIYIMTGSRHMWSEAFDEQQDMQATGPEFSWIPRGWPIGIELGAQWSNNESEVILNSVPVNLKGFMFELYGGPRMQGELFSLIGFPISAYIGGGITGMFVDIERERNNLKQDDTDFGFGWYAHTGVLLPGPGNTVFGLDFRWVADSELQLFGEKATADGFQISIQAAVEF